MHRITSLLLVSLLTTATLTGCGKAPESAEASVESATAQTATSAASSDAPSQAVETPAEDLTPEEVFIKFMQAYESGDRATMFELGTPRSLGRLADARRRRIVASHEQANHYGLSFDQVMTMDDRDVLTMVNTPVMTTATCGPFEILEVKKLDRNAAARAKWTQKGGGEIRFILYARQIDGRWLIDLAQTQNSERKGFIRAWNKAQQADQDGTSDASDNS